jgi:hypothetical protein
MKMEELENVGLLRCWLKDSADGEKILVRESKNGFKYLIFDNETVSYCRVGKNVGEYNTVCYDGKNGKSILEAWGNDD